MQHPLPISRRSRRRRRRRLLPFAKTEKWDGFYKIKRVLIGVYFSLVGVSAIFSCTKQDCD